MFVTASRGKEIDTERERERDCVELMGAVLPLGSSAFFSLNSTVKRGDHLDRAALLVDGLTVIALQVQRLIKYPFH